MEARRTRRRGGPCRGCHGDLMGRAFALSHPHREKIMLPACLPVCPPACLSTDVATNRRDIRSSGNKANVRARTKVYETDPVFESRDYEATSPRTRGGSRPCLTYFASSPRISEITARRRERMFRRLSLISLLRERARFARYRGFSQTYGFELARKCLFD